MTRSIRGNLTDIKDGEKVEFRDMVEERKRILNRSAHSVSLHVCLTVRLHMFATEDQGIERIPHR